MMEHIMEQMVPHHVNHAQILIAMIVQKSIVNVIVVTILLHI